MLMGVTHIHQLIGEYMEQANTNEEKVNHVNSELRLIAASREEMEAEARLIKSRERVQKHGEVFTPLWMVRLMLSNPPIQEKLRDVHATFFEPAAGEGAFLTEILRQKLEHINADTQHTRGANWKYQTLWALMSIYGIELLEDNVVAARRNMCDVFIRNYAQKTGRDIMERDEELLASARTVIRANVVQGNTLTHTTSDGRPIELSEWRQSARRKRKVERVVFRYETLFDDEREGNLFDEEYVVEPPSREFNLFTDYDRNGELIAKEPPADRPRRRQYKEVDIMQVYREELC